MGWASGSDLVIDISKAIKKSVKDPKVKQKLYKAVVEAAEGHDWDCQNEALGIDPILDTILNVSED